MKQSLDLDVDSPEKVPQVLERAAEAYYDASLELASAWQDRYAGKIWAEFAKILDQASVKAQKAMQKHVSYRR